MKVNVYKQPKDLHDHIWRCDIEEGPGYYGTGETRGEALMNAAVALRLWERHTAKAQ